MRIELQYLAYPMQTSSDREIRMTLSSPAGLAIAGIGSHKPQLPVSAFNSKPMPSMVSARITSDHMMSFREMPNNSIALIK